MSRKTLISLVVAAALIASITFTIFIFIWETRRPKLPELGRVQPFTLVDSRNNAFSSDLLRGKVWIASFFFTTCSDICPMMMKNLANLNKSFELDERIRLLAVTVNPEQDTPDVLAKYAEAFRGKNRHWYFLTGPREDIRSLAVDQFKLGDIEQPVFHSSYFPLVDRQGYIRGYYDGTDPEEIKRLFNDAARLLKER